MTSQLSDEQIAGRAVWPTARTAILQNALYSQMPSDKVFAQVERLASPQIDDVWRKLDRDWGTALSPDAFNSTLPLVLGRLSEDAIKEIATLTVQACSDAHASVNNRRNRKWSIASFQFWCFDRIDGASSVAKGKWPDTPGTPWADLKGEYDRIVDMARFRERCRADGLIRQHFAKSTKNDFTALAESMGAVVKAVPGGVFTWIFGGALALFLELARRTGVPWPF